MRGGDEQTGELFSYVTSDERANALLRGHDPYTQRPQPVAEAASRRRLRIRPRCPF